MKHLKLFESFNDIETICKEYGIKNWTINPDGTIDVDGGVYLDNRRLTKLPLKFRRVSGDFYCSDNQLTTLEGVTKVVVGHFDCSYNPLPKEILNFNDKKYILKWQDDYVIWQHGKLNQYRFKEMIKDYDLG